MSNRDGRRAKINKNKKSSQRPGKKCPVCQSVLEKCDQAWKDGHKHHRFCKTCGYSNF